MEEKQHRLYYVTSLGLIAIGLAVSTYLANLYVQLNLGRVVDSFCAINEQFNCVTVADCDYSTMFGIPIAVYGIQFYLVLLAVLSCAGLFRFPVKNWVSFQFFLSAISLPVSIFLALISVYWIESFCILCGSVYLVNTLLFVIAGVAGRWRMGELLLTWFWELRASVKASHLFEFAFVGLILLVVSEFFFLPRAFDFDSNGENILTSGSQHQASSSDPFMLGSPDAPVKIKEFTDFECPFCSRAHQALLEVYNKYPAEVSIRHYDYPLDHSCNPRMQRPFHADACSAAKYAKCAGAQQKFWPFEKLLFSNQRRLQPANLDRLAQSAGLDLKALHECVVDPNTVAAILADIEAGAAIELQGTPTFVINGEVMKGLRSVEFWEKRVLALLSQAKLAKAMDKREQSTAE